MHEHLIDRVGLTVVTDLDRQNEVHIKAVPTSYNQTTGSAQHFLCFIYFSMKSS